jgi:light-regulated signal transduction histidine kinase (bacteriophytochrome)
MGFSLEVTERKKSENIVKRNAKHLEKINKELNQFAYIISHDLKAPLRAISSLSTWIEEDLNSIQHPDVINNLTLLRNRVNRLENLINGILQYTRAGKTNDVYENINIETLLADLINSIEVPESFSILIKENIPGIFFSKAVLNQVFQNLITNSIKHHHKNKGTIEIQYRKIKNFHEFAVVDDGPGIDKKFHERIFTIFQTLKSRDKLESTGIGLTIVKKLIEDRGGRIFIESEIGKGSRFIFRIPDKTQDINPS